MSVDFVSTSGTDVETARCAQLLAAVIAQAVADAGQSFFTEEKKGFKPNSEAGQAIQWLFEEDGTFDAYAQLIGLNPQKVREALLSDVPLKPGHDKSMWSEITRRNLQIRHRHYLAWKAINT